MQGRVDATTLRMVRPAGLPAVTPAGKGSFISRSGPVNFSLMCLWGRDRDGHLAQAIGPRSCWMASSSSGFIQSPPHPSTPALEKRLEASCHPLGLDPRSALGHSHLGCPHFFHILSLFLSS